MFGVVVIQHGSIVNPCHYIRISLSPNPSPSLISSVRGRKTLNKQPVDSSQLEPFSIITSSTILNLHHIYLARGLDNVAKKRLTLAADNNNESGALPEGRRFSLWLRGRLYRQQYVIKNQRHLFRLLVYVLSMVSSLLKRHKQIPEMLTVGFYLAYFAVQLAVITHSTSIAHTHKKKPTTTNNCFLSTGSNDLRLKFPISAVHSVSTRLLCYSWGVHSFCMGLNKQVFS